MKPLVTAVTLTVACACGPGAKEASSFDTSDDGWTIVGDASATSSKPDFNGTGGNPGGLISAKDAVTGGTWYFVAPSKYLGNQSSVYGLKLTFDVKTTNVSSPFSNYDVVLKSETKQLVYTTKIPMVDVWNSYSVPLDETGWRVAAKEVVSELKAGDFDKLTPATAEDLKAVLGALTSLRLRGEFNEGEDQGSLDNVRWGAP